MVAFLLALASCGPSGQSEPASQIHGPQAKPKPVIGVGQFYDARRENGSSIDIPGMPQESRYINETDLGPGVASALTRELVQAGYPVVQYSTVPPDTVAYTMTGKIPELSLRRVVFQLKVNRGGMILLDRQYVGEAKGLDNPNEKVTRAQLQASLMQAYQELVKRVMRDVTRVTR